MSGAGYIYVKNWDRFQHYKNRRPAWIKLYLDLFNDDEYLGLTPSDRCLLQACWMAAAEYGNGRARADQSSLRARAKTPKGNLKPLINAGFIEVRASKALAEVLAPELEEEKEHPLPPQGGNGFHPETPQRLTRKQRAELERKQKRQGAVHRCTFLYHQYLDEGETPAQVREHLEREYRHDPSIVTEAIGAA